MSVSYQDVLHCLLHVRLEKGMCVCVHKVRYCIAVLLHVLCIQTRSVHPHYIYTGTDILHTVSVLYRYSTLPLLYCIYFVHPMLGGCEG